MHHGRGDGAVLLPSSGGDNGKGVAGFQMVEGMPPERATGVPLVLTAEGVAGGGDTGRDELPESERPPLPLARGGIE